MDPKMDLNGPVTVVGRGNESRANAMDERETVRIAGYQGGSPPPEALTRSRRAAIP